MTSGISVSEHFLHEREGGVSSKHGFGTSHNKKSFMFMWGWTRSHYKLPGKEILFLTLSFSNSLTSNQNSSHCLCNNEYISMTHLYPLLLSLVKEKIKFSQSHSPALQFDHSLFGLKATNHRLWHEYLEFQEQTKSGSKPMTRNWVSFRQFVDGSFRSCWLLSCFLCDIYWVDK